MVPRGSHRHCALTAHCVACQALQLYGSMADHMQCTFKPELDAVRPSLRESPICLRGSRDGPRPAKANVLG